MGPVARNRQMKTRSQSRKEDHSVINSSTTTLTKTKLNKKIAEKQIKRARRSTLLVLTSEAIDFLTNKNVTEKREVELPRSHQTRYKLRGVTGNNEDSPPKENYALGTKPGNSRAEDFSHVGTTKAQNIAKVYEKVNVPQSLQPADSLAFSTVFKSIQPSSILHSCQFSLKNPSKEVQPNVKQELCPEVLIPSWESPIVLPYEKKSIDLRVPKTMASPKRKSTRIKASKEVKDEQSPAILISPKKSPIVLPYETQSTDLQVSKGVISPKRLSTGIKVSREVQPKDEEQSPGTLISPKKSPIVFPYEKQSTDLKLPKKVTSSKRKSKRIKASREVQPKEEEKSLVFLISPKKSPIALPYERKSIDLRVPKKMTSPKRKSTRIKASREVKDEQSPAILISPKKSPIVLPYETQSTDLQVSKGVISPKRISTRIKASTEVQPKEEEQSPAMLISPKKSPIALPYEIKSTDLQVPKGVISPKRISTRIKVSREVQPKDEELSSVILISPEKSSIVLPYERQSVDVKVPKKVTSPKRKSTRIKASREVQPKDEEHSSVILISPKKSPIVLPYETQSTDLQVSKGVISPKRISTRIKASREAQPKDEEQSSAILISPGKPPIIPPYKRKYIDPRVPTDFLTCEIVDENREVELPGSYKKSYMLRGATVNNEDSPPKENYALGTKPGNSRAEDTFSQGETTKAQNIAKVYKKKINVPHSQKPACSLAFSTFFKSVQPSSILNSYKFSFENPFKEVQPNVEQELCPEVFFPPWESPIILPYERNPTDLQVSKRVIPPKRKSTRIKASRKVQRKDGEQSSAILISPKTPIVLPYERQCTHLQVSKGVIPPKRISTRIKASKEVQPKDEEESSVILISPEESPIIRPSKSIDYRVPTKVAAPERKSARSHASFFSMMASLQSNKRKSKTPVSPPEAPSVPPALLMSSSTSQVLGEPHALENSPVASSSKSLTQLVGRKPGRPKRSTETSRPNQTANNFEYSATEYLWDTIQFLDDPYVAQILAESSNTRVFPKVGQSSYFNDSSK